jgi:hypothetical protein
MKQIVRSAVVIILFFGISTAMAGKPQDVIERSNGYPSGAHFNLNIHGKDTDTFTCDQTPGGNSVFISEYGTSTIQYVTNKRSSVTELTALDPCAECLDNDGDPDTCSGYPAKVQLPYEEKGFWVFTRLRGKPNNGANDGDPSSVLLYPNDVVGLCNDDPLNPDPNFPDYTDYTECLLPLGLITVRDVYDATTEGFVRFDPIETKGKGKGKAVDITRLFMWSGWSCDATLDIYPIGEPDGVIDENDVPIEYDYIENGGNENGIIDDGELQAWLNSVCDYHDNQWILNIADLVVSQQSVDNDGAKLLKIRFYPVATTEFIPE